MLPELYFLARSIAVPLTGLLSSQANLLHCKEKCILNASLRWQLIFFPLNLKYGGRTLNRNYKQLSPTLPPSFKHGLKLYKLPECAGSWFLYSVRTNNLLLELILQPCIKLLTLFINNLCLLKEYGVIYHN